MLIPQWLRLDCRILKVKYATRIPNFLWYPSFDRLVGYADVDLGRSDSMSHDLRNRLPRASKVNDCSWLVCDWVIFHP